MPSVGVEHVDTFALRLARWFDFRLLETVPPLRSTTQLYGLEVIDPDGIDTLDPAAVRVAFITEGPDEPAVLADPLAARADDFDAVVTVAHGWRPPEATDPRPGAFRGRRRELLVRVIDVRQLRSQ